MEATSGSAQAELQRQGGPFGLRPHVCRYSVSHLHLVTGENPLQLLSLQQLVLKITKRPRLASLRPQQQQQPLQAD
jgi:hypothetical protein